MAIITQCVNNTIKNISYVTIIILIGTTLAVDHKNYTYAYTYYFACAYCCRSYPLACEYLYPYGQEDQKYPQCSGSDYRYYMAASGFWPVRFNQGGKGLNKPLGVNYKQITMCILCTLFYLIFTKQVPFLKR